jgi:L-fuconolactonase
MIDSHQHFWDPALEDYGWLHPCSTLYRAYQPKDLWPLLEVNGVLGSILVQAAPTARETDYLLDLARRNPWILGVVGWVDLSARDAPQLVRERASNPLFVGIRPMLQDMTERDWILGPHLCPAIEAVQEAAIVFDALVQADQLPVIASLADRYASLSIVLDHAGKPPFGTLSAVAGWRAQMQSLADRANVYCKLSGLFTELGDVSADQAIDPCIDTLIDLFGPDRLLWGSDWPVSTTAIEYSDWLIRCRSRVETRLAGHHAEIFGGNARRLYRLDRGCACRAWEPLP